MSALRQTDQLEWKWSMVALLDEIEVFIRGFIGEFVDLDTDDVELASWWHDFSRSPKRQWIIHPYLYAKEKSSVPLTEQTYHLADNHWTKSSDACRKAELIPLFIWQDNLDAGLSYTPTSLWHEPDPLGVVLDSHSEGKTKWKNPRTRNVSVTVERVPRAEGDVFSRVRTKVYTEDIKTMMRETSCDLIVGIFVRFDTDHPNELPPFFEQVNDPFR